MVRFQYFFLSSPSPNFAIPNYAPPFILTPPPFSSRAGVTFAFQCVLKQPVYSTQLGEYIQTQWTTEELHCY